ncbi:MAG: NADAR family protein [Smithella sp.]
MGSAKIIDWIFDKNDIIDNFEQKHFFLSNFYPVEIVYNGKVYPSTEHAYQATKTFVESESEAIRTAETPARAKKLGKVATKREDWNEVKINVMKDLLRIKFDIPELRDALLNTYPSKLVEGNWWGDKFWGVCENVGENNLGKLLMDIRDEIRSTNIPHILT